MKCKDLQVKELEIIMENTRFEIEIPSSETRNDKVVKTYVASAIKGKHIIYPR